MAKTRRKEWCSAVKCKSSGAKHPELSFFRFPKDEERCAEWVLKCGRKDLQGKSAEYLYTNCRICSKHFEQKEILNTGRLVWNAVPTNFKHHHKKSGRQQREMIKQIPERSGRLGQRLKKKLACLDTENEAAKKEATISQEPLSKYLKFSAKDLELRIINQQKNTPSRILQSSEKEDGERNETVCSQETPSHDMQTSGGSMTVIEMDHSYINQDSEMSDGHQETVIAEGVHHQILEEDEWKTLDEIQSPHQGISEHFSLQPVGQKSSGTVCILSPYDASGKPISGSQTVHFQLVCEKESPELTCLEVDEGGSYFLLSSDVPQQGVPPEDSCPSTSGFVQIIPNNLQNENSSHSIHKAAQIKNPPQKATAKVVPLQVSSKVIHQNGHQPPGQPVNIHKMTPHGDSLGEQAETNIEKVHHEEIVVAGKCTRKSAKKSSLLRVRLYRAKLKIKKLEAALEKYERKKTRHKEKKKRALKEVSWASLTSNKRKPHGRRYSEKHKMFALGLYQQSRKAYQFCRKELSLPSVRSLQAWIKKGKVKRKEILSESEAACIPRMDLFERNGDTDEGGAPLIVGLLPEQDDQRSLLCT